MATVTNEQELDKALDDVLAANGVEIDFFKLESDAEIVEGAEATVENVKASGEYTMPDGQVYSFDNGIFFNNKSKLNAAYNQAAKMASEYEMNVLKHEKSGKPKANHISWWIHKETECNLLMLHVNVGILKKKSVVTPMDGFDFIHTKEENAPFSSVESKTVPSFFKVPL